MAHHLHHLVSLLPPDPLSTLLHVLLAPKADLLDRICQLPYTLPYGWFSWRSFLGRRSKESEARIFITTTSSLPGASTTSHCSCHVVLLIKLPCQVPGSPASLVPSGLGMSVTCQDAVYSRTLSELPSSIGFWKMLCPHPILPPWRVFYGHCFHRALATFVFPS